MYSICSIVVFLLPVLLHLGTILAPCWYHLGFILAPFWRLFGIFLRGHQKNSIFSRCYLHWGVQRVQNDNQNPQKTSKKLYNNKTQRTQTSKKLPKSRPRVAEGSNVHGFWEPFGIQMGTESRKAVIHANVRFTNVRLRFAWVNGVPKRAQKPSMELFFAMSGKTSKKLVKKWTFWAKMTNLGRTWGDKMEPKTLPKTTRNTRAKKEWKRTTL